MDNAGLDIFQILLESGVVVKSVLVILVACSVLSWAIIIQKKKEFHNFFVHSTNLVDIYEQSKVLNDSTLSVMFTHGYEELTKIREKLKTVGKEGELKLYFNQAGIQALERSLKQGANNSSEFLDSRLTTLASIGSISPFIGLFGTVWGIINSFAGLASGGGSIEAVAPGIAEALVATAIGLAAAIPAVWAYNLFNAKISSFNTGMENFGQEFLNLIERSVLITKD
jgi:biopolymer transport protein TolQ